MKKQTKYVYEYVLQGNYGDNWCDLVSYDKSDFGAYKEAKADLKCYRENEPKSLHRIIERRTLRLNQD